MEPLPSSPPGSGPAEAVGSPDAAGRPAPAPAGRSSRAGRWPFDRRTAAIAAGVLLVAGALLAGTGYRYEFYAEQPLILSSEIPLEARALQQFTARLHSRQRALAARLDALRPKGVYIVIDQTQNRLYLRRGDETLLQAVCSAGSGMVLRESGGRKREWVFDSPRGGLEVRTMLRDPIWKEPK